MMMQFLGQDVPITACIICLQLEGRQLPPEKIIFGNQKSHSAGEQADWGRAATREHVISAVSS